MPETVRNRIPGFLKDKNSLSLALFFVFAALVALLAVIPDVKLTRPKLLFAESVLYGLFALWLVSKVSRGVFELKASLLNVPVAAYLAVSALFYAFSPDKPVALNELKRNILSAAVFFLAEDLLGTEKRRNAFVWCWLSGLFVAASYGVMQHSGGIGRVMVPGFDRVISTFGNPIFFGAFIVAGVPVAAGEFLKNRNRIAKAFLAVLIVLSLTALYYTKTRASFIGLAVSLILFFFGILRSGRMRYLLAALVVAGFALFVANTSSLWTRHQAHALIWRDSAAMWASKPVFGTGPGTFHVYFPDFASEELKRIWPQDQFIVNDAHNEYVQMLAETGIAGFGMFVWLLASFGVMSVVRIKGSDGAERIMTSAFAASGAGLLAQNLFSVDMRFIISSLYFFAAAGAIGSFTKETFSVRIGPKTFRVVLSAAIIALCAHMYQKMLAPYAAERKVAHMNDFFDEKVLEPAKTIGELEALAKEYPEQGLVFEKLGWVYAKERNWDKAIRNFRKSIELRPGVFGPYNNLGNIYFLLGDRKTAIGFWERSLEINPGQIDSRLNLATAYYYNGQLKAAVGQIKEVLKIEKDNEKALVLLKQMKE
ncbi:MAG: O-antigen ligase family protein [Endomicrobiales bacterium]|nr:O-antigen ligase family protein [Endomicrobiales bacterium]